MTLTHKSYIPRVSDAALTKHLNVAGAVCVEGPKWCGKTWLSLNHADSVYYVGDPSNNFQNRQRALLDPSSVLEGRSPRLIDEWQEVPGIWDAVRFQCDTTSEHGQYILTGSSTPLKKGVLHSGTGRITRVALRTMSLFESGDSDGSVSLQTILNNDLKPTPCKEVSLKDLAYYIIRGGWPALKDTKEHNAQMLLRSYVENIPTDMERVDGVNRNPELIFMLLRSLARNESTLASNATLVRDIQDQDQQDVHRDTIEDYLGVLNQLFLIENQPAYSVNIRSSIRVGKKVKRHMADPSLAAALLGLNTKGLIDNLTTFGFLFEALAERDLSIYGSMYGATLKHYRDNTGHEVDAILEFSDGRRAAFEVKLGAHAVDEGAQALLKFQSLMLKDTHSVSPFPLCVITGLGNIAYTRDDGVMVVPLAALRD